MSAGSAGLSRRAMLGQAGLAGLAAAWPAGLLAAGERFIPQRPSARIIIDNDFAGDPDGLVALAHQLLTPKTRTTLITSSALDARLTGDGTVGATAAAGRDIAVELMRRGGFTPVEVLAGSETPGAGAAQISAAAHGIVAEAMRDDPLPLFITCGGPLTNVAAALRLEPAIARRATLVWIGGGRYPEGGWEYNLNADVAAARQVIEESALPVWQIPQSAYRLMQISNAELRVRMRSISPFGRWLYDRFTSPPSFIDVGGSWPLGDSPLVLLTAISAESSLFRDQDARRIMPDGRYGEGMTGRRLRVFETVDARLTFEDFLALMQLQAAGGR